MITVPSRVLDKPSLQYTLKSRQFSSQAMVTEVSPTADGSWNFRSKRFHEPANVGTWYILRIAKGNPRNNLPPKTTLVKNLQRFEEIVKNTGITKGTTKTKDIVLNNINTDCSEVETYLEHIYKEKLASKDAVEEHPPDNGKSPQREEKHPPLLLVILPGSANRLYQRIKDYADRHGGFHTICVTGTGADEGVPEPYKCSSGSDKKFYAERADAYFANVALKINLKFNGINHILQNPEVLGPINEGSTMVVGIDVTHPSPGSNDEAPSIFALVASIDKNLAQWPAALGVQKKSRQEVISDKDKLMALFRSRLDLWAQRNGGRLPDKIIVYRDGVSEGQYEQVIDEELAALKEACREPYHSSNDSSNMPRFTFIIVAKRHHTRFFPTAIEDADQNSNAKCGTVVDRGITQARDWDFYLQSHSVVQEGTARPAHYVVLHDEIFRDYRNKSDMLQQVTYNMCYLYGPSTRAISICPPVYLADKACTRARLYLQDQFEPAPLEAKDSRDGDEEETDQEKAARLQREAEVLQSQQERLMVHEDLRDTMYYI